LKTLKAYDRAMNPNPVADALEELSAQIQDAAAKLLSAPIQTTPRCGATFRVTHGILTTTYR